MKNKYKWTYDIMFFVLAFLCASMLIVLMFLDFRLAFIPLVIFVLLMLLAFIFARKIRYLISKVILGVANDEKSYAYTLGNFSTPLIVVSEKTVLWYNTAFKKEILQGESLSLPQLSKVVPNFNLELSESASGQHLWVDNRSWHIFSSTIKRKGEKISVVYLTEETKLQNIAQEYLLSRPGCMIIAVDGYSDVFGDLLDSERARILEGLNLIIEEIVVHSSKGVLRRYASGRYIAVLEERHLERLANGKYELLDKIRALDENLNLTVSIGIGRGGDTLEECQNMATQALDMAKGRGGDQVAEKTKEGYSFYGGVSQGVEKRSKVKARRFARALVELIKQSESVVIMGHRMTDLDAIGAAEGVLRICKICGVPAVIAVRKNATLAKSAIDAFEKAGLSDDFITPEDALEAVSAKTLCVVVDTYTRAIVESNEILQACENVVVIDHHRKTVGHIENVALLYQEPYASSACELVCEILQYVGTSQDKPTRIEAEVMLAGIMLDTRDFAIHTGVRTFEAAAVLRRYGAETENVKALFQTNADEYRVKSQLVGQAKTYKGCAIVASRELPASMMVAVPMAANDLLGIEGVQASFVAVQKGNNVNISARSMGEVNVQVIIEALGGGGHQMMAGTQMKDISIEDAFEALCHAIDNYREQKQKK